MFKWLTFGFAGSLTLILAFTLTNHLPAPNPITASFFSAVVNLAYGFAASYIFYIINIYIPENKRIKNDGESIAEHLAAMLTLSNKYLTFFTEEENLSGTEIVTYRRVAMEEIDQEYRAAITLCSDPKIRASLITTFSVYFSTYTNNDRDIKIQQLHFSILNLLITSFCNEVLEKHRSSLLAKYIYYRFKTIERKKVPHYSVAPTPAPPDTPNVTQVQNMDVVKEGTSSCEIPYSVQADYTLAHYNHIERIKSNIYSAVINAGQFASRSLFLLTTGGCVALLSYLAQHADEKNTEILKTALYTLAISTLLSTFQTALVYTQLSFDYYCFSSSYDNEMNIKPNICSIRKSGNFILCSACVFLWLWSFYLCYSGLNTAYSFFN